MSVPEVPVPNTRVQNPGGSYMSIPQVLTGPSQSPAVQPTHSLMPIKTNKIILPGESMELTTDMPDQTVVIEGWLPHHWPEPQLVSIAQGKLQVTNNQAVYRATQLRT